MLNTLKHQYLAILWAGFILIMCDIPIEGDGVPTFFEGFDKLTHTCFFFVFTVFLFYGKILQQNSYSYRLITIAKIFLITALMGGGIEILQWKVFTYRSAEWWDFFCDILGVCMGIFSYILLHRLRFEKTV